MGGARWEAELHSAAVTSGGVEGGAVLQLGGAAAAPAG